ncbi:tetratricopeptide repeat protein [Petroclostridium sp. X23]|uniref:tetratricopeptide repeat protein n=1 Tax=Petroclostridium sp. X23 TaxID=3045146 RepID=UPI0024AC9F7B|nr:tetratricopeptide repeat protein [Petroclostridium sp. X23]WHH60906.1 tetratricopeptide repeat protein [Petroclostridium sp. X23]
MTKVKATVFLFITFVVISVHTLCFAETIDTKDTMDSQQISAEHLEQLIEAVEANETGYSLMQEGKYEEAIKLFQNAIKLGLQNDAALNNLSWAYYELGEYQKSFEYSEKSLAIQPNEDAEYVNYGNALYGLGKYEEALKAFNNAIKMNEKSSYAYYGRGMTYFAQGKFKEAFGEFEKCLLYTPDDYGAQCYKAICYLLNGSEKKALQYIEQCIEKQPDISDLYLAKGNILEYTSTYDEIMKFYEDASKLFPDDISFLSKLGRIAFNAGNYDKVLEYFIPGLKKYPKELELYYGIIYSYSAQGNFDKVKEYCLKAINNNKKDPELYNIIGMLYLDETLYKDSVQYFDTAIKLDKNYLDAYLNKMFALYITHRYSKCIEVGNSIRDKFDANESILWYIADSYYGLDKFDEAIKTYGELVSINDKDDSALSFIAMAYYRDDNIGKAKEYVDKCLDINPDNQQALWIKTEVENKDKPFIKQLEELFVDNYLYYDDSIDIKSKIATLKDNANITDQEINNFVEDIKMAEDQFTFVVSGKDYDYVKSNEEEDIALMKMSDHLYYTRILSFNGNTDERFIELMDTIEDTQNKTLIIDLRSNTGGVTDSATNILNEMLPECKTSYLIYKDGYTYDFYSDASQTKFKKIYIFVDEYTASASELTTLGLKTFLNNVTIIGQKTYGKGVGQYVYENSKRKVMLFIVNHYWNVRQKNILNDHIEPDIYVESDNIEDYFKAIDDLQ